MKLRRITADENFNPSAVVTSSEIFSRKTETIDDEGNTIEVKEFNPEGLFSRKIFGMMNTESEYSCECGKTTGAYFAGTTCEKCGTVVEKQLANIDRVGWIDLCGHHLIKYIAYMMLEKIIGRENIKNIIQVPSLITMSGELDTAAIEAIQNEEGKPEQKYWYVGIEYFYENYNEILDYYFYLTHKPEEELEMVLDSNGIPKLDKDGNQLYKEPKKQSDERRMKNFICSKFDVFTDKIPVLPAVLRPAMRTEDGLKLDAINVLYVNILKNVEILRDKVNNLEMIKNITVQALQSQYFQLSENAIDIIKSKNGLIRNQICGTRINFSARNIISPAKSGYKMDEIVLPYLTFLELYKYEIINVLSRIKNISLIEAEEIVFDASINFSEDVYMVMKKIIQDEEVGVLLNRNPTVK